jgi:hypothetical protein
MEGSGKMATAAEQAEHDNMSVSALRHLEYGKRGERGWKCVSSYADRMMTEVFVRV